MASCSVAEIEKIFDALFPIPRSLAGEPVRESLRILQEVAPIEICSVPSGKPLALGWSTPPEWSVEKATLTDVYNNVLIDFRWNPLHLVSYSVPFDGLVTLDQLNNHLYSEPRLPEAIPYHTNYYGSSWGFCLAHKERTKLTDEHYKVSIETKIYNGVMNWGEYLIRGQSEKELVITTYICHPNLANNELSGPLVSIFLLRKIIFAVQNDDLILPFSVRFVFGPETVGAIHQIQEIANGDRKVLGVLVLTCVGDSGRYTVKRSFHGNSFLDRYLVKTFVEAGGVFGDVVDFFPWGSDERQFNYPHSRRPACGLSRTMYGRYPEYHTSLDDKSLICFSGISETIEKIFEMILSMAKDNIYLNTDNFSHEPKLDVYGLYPQISNIINTSEFLNAVRWLLVNDGYYSVEQLVEITKIDNRSFQDAAEHLREAGLVI